MSAGAYTPRLYRPIQRIFWPWVLLALCEMAAILVVLAVLLPGRTLVAAGALLALIAFGVLRLQRYEDGSLALKTTLVVLRTEIFIRGGKWERAASDDDSPARVRAPGPSPRLRLHFPGRVFEYGREAESRFYLSWGRDRRRDVSGGSAAPPDPDAGVREPRRPRGPGPMTGDAPLRPPRG